ANIIIAVSHDGLMSEGGRKYPPSAGLLEDKLRLLLKYQPYAISMTTVNPLAADLFADSVEWLYNQGFRYLITSPAHGAHIPWDEAGCAALEEQYKKLAQLYIKWTKEGKKFYLGAFETKIASHIEGDKYTQKHCHIGKDQVSVAVDGKIYPCVQFVGNQEYCLGDVWRGIAPELQTALALHRCGSPLCEGCAVQNRCIHTCGCMNSLDTGSVDQVSPFQCRHEKMLIAIADKMAEKLYRGKNRRFIAKHYDPAYPLVSLIEDGLRRIN
ncbi:MAG: SPASM domain-containing protein, partial [Clostridiales bacterium]|nr:SPASM domain-containing protein [Clostridiales bacterium]